jgi:hypothetical protein
MSQVNARLVYKNALRAMSRAGADPSTAILSQSFLRLEAVVSNNVTSYRFGVLVNDSSTNSTAPRATETRLQLQDAFYVGSIQWFLGLATSTTATDYAPITWNNQFQFSNTGAATALNNFYNGSYSLTVNNRVITPNLPMVRHKYVPILQQNAAAGSGVNTDAFDGMENTALACEPNWVLIGSKGNQLVLNLPSAIGTLQTTPTGVTTVISCVMSGILAQNVTSVV